MLEELKEEAIIEKVGGRFKLSTLIQKRIVQLKQGSRPLVDLQADNMMELVLQEILQDKITLDTDNQVMTPEGETVVTDVPNINPLEL
jgi:DNA-directed RNA polymerase subunit omega